MNYHEYEKAKREIIFRNLPPEEYERTIAELVERMEREEKK